MLKRMMISCKQATSLASRAQEENLSIMESIKLKIHCYLCPPCAFFVKQLNQILKLIGKTFKSDDIHFTEQQKSTLEELIKKNA